ncbi:MAG: acyl dehydratase [Rhodobacteraceae bacterium]|nr:acyl dehydratase [Paracoccaceae bacterium]MAY45319.1 acyl dehydratase [Paracoccaceae bacterium]
MMAQRIETEWITVDAARTRAYAVLTDDYNPIHLDEGFAARTPLGRPIAHGTLSMAHLLRLLDGILGRDAMMVGEVLIRFRAPVYVETRVRAVVERGDADAPFELRVEREDGTVALSGSFIPGPGAEA